MLHRLDVGVGPRRLLLLPGNDLGGGWYRPLAERLAHHRIATRLVTLPGFDGVAPLAAPSWDGLVDLVCAAIAEEPVDIVAGHSMGGLFALLAAASLGARLPGLALLEPAIFPGRLLATLAARRYRKVVVDARRDVFSNHNGGMRRLARPAATDPHFIASWLASRGRGDVETGRRLFEALPGLYPLPWDRVTARTLLVTGAHTGLVGRLMAADIARALPTPPTRVTVDAAHWLIPEANDAVADALGAFVSALPRS